MNLQNSARYARKHLGRLAITSAKSGPGAPRADVVAERFPSIGPDQRALLLSTGPQAAAVESVDMPASIAAGQMYLAESQGTLLGRTPVLADVKLNAAFGAFPGQEPTGIIKASGQPTPLRKFDFAQVTVPAIRASVMTALSTDFVDDTNAEPGIQRMMSRALDKTADTHYIAEALDGAGAVASGADSGYQLRRQVRAMVADVLVPAGANASTIILAANPTTLLLLATASNAMGDAAFPGITLSGGALCGLPLLPSFGVADGAIVAIAGDAVLRAAGSIEVLKSEHAMLEFADNPTGAAVPGEAPVAQARKQVSLWQAGCVALNTYYVFGVGFTRAVRAAFIDGVTLEGPTTA